MIHRGANSASADSVERPPVAPAPPRITAVLFDMDGVVTDTAQAHAAAWKRLFDEYLRRRADQQDEPFKPFDPVRDYRDYVDGKPRYDGVESFLDGRGITLPRGSADDAPDSETLCGLGNRKNRYFRDWLARHRVATFPGTLALIRKLKQAGIKVAVFSSSRNAEAVLRNAGVLALFDVRIDGNDLVKYRLPGKPDPAMLREAAARLATTPQHAAVIEDAVAGVEAGVRGGFGLVIGVDRGGNGAALRRAGAELVVADPAELTVASANALVIKKLSSRPLVRDRELELQRRLSGKVPMVFLDYDGTLTPIVEDYTKALLSADMRAALAELGKRCTVAIVSGRDLGLLRRLVQLDSLYYAGSHGFEVSGPSGWHDRLEKGIAFLPQLDAAETQLRQRLGGIAGHAVERKRFAIAVHYRRAAAADCTRIEAVVDRVLCEHQELRKGYGKKVFELRPDLDWDKGRAVLWLFDRLRPRHTDAVALYVGDDITDEDAFRALADNGLNFVVRGAEDRPTAADYALADTADVKRLLEFLTEQASATSRPAGTRL